MASFGESSKAASRNIALVLSTYSLVADLAFVVMASCGALLVQSGSLPLFVYIGFIIASVEFYKPFFAMESHWMNYLKVRDSFRRIEKIIRASSVPEPDERACLRRTRLGSIRCVSPMEGTLLSCPRQRLRSPNIL